MATTQKHYSPRFKARAAVEAIRAEKTLNQLASRFQVHPIQIGQWRKTALERMAELLANGRKRRNGGAGSGRPKIKTKKHA